MRFFISASSMKRCCDWSCKQVGVAASDHSASLLGKRHRQWLQVPTRRSSHGQYETGKPQPRLVPAQSHPHGASKPSLSGRSRTGSPHPPRGSWGPWHPAAFSASPAKHGSLAEQPHRSHLCLMCLAKAGQSQPQDPSVLGSGLLSERTLGPMPRDHAMVSSSGSTILKSLQQRQEQVSFLRSLLRVGVEALQFANA